MAEAVDLAKLHGTGAGRATRWRRARSAGRFADGDLAAILAHQQHTGELIPLPPGPQRTLAAALDPLLGGIRTMNTPNHARATETDAQGGDLRPSGDSPRPIARPDRSSNTQIGGRR